jgi:hypothetical protein
MIQQAEAGASSMMGKVFLTVLIAGALCSTPVRAAFNTGGEEGALRTLSAKTMGVSRINIGTGISIFQSIAYVGNVYNRHDSAITSADVNRDPGRMLSSNLFLGAGLTPFWDIGIALPFYYDWMGYDNISDNGIGDL